MPNIKNPTSTLDYYLLDGKVLQWQGETTMVSSPILNERGEKTPLGSTPRMTAEAALLALDAAKTAWNNGRGLWPTISPQNRIEATKVFVEEMKKVRSDVVRLLMWEIGKTLPDSEKEFDRTVEYIEATIREVEKLIEQSATPQATGGILARTLRAPLGVCLCVGPFNYPLNETFTTLIPALIMGNTLVVKTPKYGILLFEPLLAAFAKAFPRGSINFIYGDGSEILGPILASGKLDSFAFIGTSRVADILKKQHPSPHRMRCILGLDAKNPALIMEDADLDVAVRESVAGALSFNGQRCTGLKMFFVHKNIAQEFLTKFARAIDALPAGNPWELGVKITPLPETGKVDWLEHLVQDATSKGANVLTHKGGKVNETLFRPVLLHPVSEACELYTKEQFGPVVPARSYQDEEEFIDYVTNSNFGQQVSIFGKDEAKIAKVVRALTNQVCRININGQCQRGPDNLPFTGRKDSAEGTLSISDALRCFSIRTVIATPITETLPE